jgi:hemoglobin
MTSVLRLVLGIVLIGGWFHVGFAQTSAASESPKDGAIALPLGYQNGPKFLSEVQRPDIKQVRELFINAVGAATKVGQPFPNGTVMVMELYTVTLDGDAPVTGPDGKLLKGDLAKIFVMAKGEGWGKMCQKTSEQETGSLVSMPLTEKPWPKILASAEVVMRPLAMKDFVPRYDKYFEKRAVR